MNSVIKLFLVLITLTVIVVAWITHSLSTPRIQLLVIILVGVTLAAFFVLNLLDHRDQRRKRAEREASRDADSTPMDPDQKRSDTDFSLRDKKAGLTWGGGNIKASEATRGTKRKFLGR